MSESLVFRLLLVLATVMVVGHLLGRLFRVLGQPPVIGEVVGGILLGPSLLGALSPGAYRFLLPQDVVPVLGAVAQLGVILYMFLTGLELDFDRLRSRLRHTVVISNASIALPFVLGSLLALYLYPTLAPADVPRLEFALFMGVAMSITAFPVLARILSDLKMSKSEIGALALSAAAMGDVTAWCVLAIVVGIIQSSAGGSAIVLLLTAVFVAVVITIVRPIVARWVRRHDEDPTHGTIALALAAMLVSALATQAIGVHPLFGAFAAGAVIPHDSRFAREIVRNFEPLIVVLLLPAFFAFAGMRTEIGLLSTGTHWLICAGIVLVATVGKCGGTLTGATLVGMPLRQAAALGVLMNTRGLMELIVLNVGLELGVISPTLYTMMVIMALVTTMATAPVVTRMLRTG